MMHSFHFGAGLHSLACLLILLGILFLVYWALKTLPLKKLRIWGIGFLVAGIVLCVLAFAADGFGGRKFAIRMMDGNHMMMNGDMMDDMMPGKRMMMDADADGMMSMQMKGMTMMLEGKTGDEFDEAFIRMMIPHHEGAIEMAKLAEANAKHQEIKDLAKAILAAQQQEIDWMNGWLKSWNY